MPYNFAKLHNDIVLGNSNGRILWQPRIQCWYDDKKFHNDPLPAKYQNKDIYGIHRELGCSARLYEFNECFKRIEDERVNQIIKQDENGKVERTITTPVGKQIEVLQKSPNNPFLRHIKWEIESKDDAKVAIWREQNCRWQWDNEKYKELLNKIGDLGAPAMFMPRMNVQSLFIEKMGIEKGIFAIYDWTDLLEELFASIEDSHNKLIDIINDSPVEIINFGENIHSGTLSPALFEKYHLPACQRRCEKLHSANKFVYSHWDGNCKPLLPYAKETGLDGIEAITPLPQGDVTLEEAKEALGDDMFLIDGIPAVYFDDTYSIETLVDCVHKVIDLFAPKLILGISDEMSSTGDIERINIVTEIVDEFNKDKNIFFE